MRSIRTTEVFVTWLAGLRDPQARIRIQLRIDRAELGNYGDCEPVGEGVRNAHPLWARIPGLLR